MLTIRLATPTFAVLALACSPARPIASTSPATTAQPLVSTAAQLPTTPKEAALDPKPTSQVVKSDDEWRRELTPEQYQVLRRKGTERAFTGKYWNFKENGAYACAGCGEELFTSSAKFDSGCGWPSFYDALAGGKVTTHDDFTHGMQRTEVLCAKCGGHLGHVFDDAPQTPTGLRYCINSASLDFIASKPAPPVDAKKP